MAATPKDNQDICKTQINVTSNTWYSTIKQSYSQIAKMLRTQGAKSLLLNVNLYTEFFTYQ